MAGDDPFSLAGETGRATPGEASFTIVPSPTKAGQMLLSPRKQGSALPPQTECLSPRAGDEDVMQDFVRLHMMSILHPFAEHMRELQGQIERLSGHMAQAQHDVSQHKSRLDQHDDQLLMARNGAAELNSRVDATQADLSTVAKEKAALDTGHKMTKATLAKAEERLKTAELAVEALQHGHREATALTSKLQNGLSNTDQKISEQIEVRLNNMHTYCKELNDRQADLLQTVQQNRANIDSTGQSLEKLTQMLEQRRQSDLESFSCLNDHAKGFEAKLTNTNQTLQRHAENVKAVDKAVQQMKTLTGQLVSVQQLHAQQSEVTLSLKEHSRRLGKAEEDIAHTRGEAANEKQAVGDLLRKLGERADVSASDIQRLKEVQGQQANQIQTAGRRSSDIETEQRKLWKRIDADEREMQSMALWQKGATDKFEEHSSELEQAHCDFRQARKSLEATDTNLNGVKADLDAARDIISKLGLRVDLCYKYFHGFGKGLQETQRHVAGGECGMLPPKSGMGQSMNLPMIPRSPRAAMSPRKAKALLGTP
mmetsp:Transcript_17730/g.31644  ORF Transcript_17730/g.31644 Transcript_17730/m.31644 type:complete len:540 (-) Transcript_17730:161-1780(-)